MSDPIASMQVLGQRRDGSTILITFAVGAPYRNMQSEAEEWRCPITLEPLYSRLAHIVGSDSMRALCLAISLGLDLLGKFVDGGGRLLHLDGTHASIEVFAFGHAIRSSNSGA